MIREELEEDVKRRAEAKAREVSARAGLKLAQLELGARGRLSGASYRVRHRRLMDLAAEAAALVAPSTPCRKGCSDCCYQAVPIARHQAELLAAASGRKMAPAGRLIDEGTVERANAMTEKMLLDPVACPFLKDNNCSVYDERPVTCRTHHVLHDDSSRCSLFHHLKLAQAKFDLGWIDGLAAAVGFDDEWADIREWFP